jgi:hypothetical protein
MTERTARACMGEGVSLQKAGLIQYPHSNPVAATKWFRATMTNIGTLQSLGVEILSHNESSFLDECGAYILLSEAGSSFLIHFHHSWNGKTEVITDGKKHLVVLVASSQYRQPQAGVPFARFLYRKSFTPLKHDFQCRQTLLKKKQHTLWVFSVLL